MVPENQTCEKFEWEKARRSSKSPYFPQDLKKDYATRYVYMHLYMHMFMHDVQLRRYSLAVIIA